MKTLGNILWHFPFLGFISATIVYLFGLLFTATVVAAPVGLGLMEFGKFLFAPFGHAMVTKSDLNIKQNKAWKTYSTIVMILYFPLGLFFAIVGILQVIGLCISIVGIPVALVIAKSLGTYLNPVNKKCVSSAVADELERRKGQAEVEKYLDPGDDKKQVQSEPTERPTSITANGRTTPNWLIPAVAGAVILVLLAGGINYYQKTQRDAGLLAQQRLAAEQERSKQKEKEVQRLAVQNVQQLDIPGFRIEADAESGELAIARGAEGWEVVIPKKIFIAIINAAPRFRILAPTLFAKKDYGVDSVGIRTASNALIADFDGDGSSDLIVIGTVDNTLTAMAALSNRGQWIVQSVQVSENFIAHNGIERHVKYFPEGSMLPDRTGRKSPSPGFSFWDDDTGGDLFFLERGKWVRAIVVGD